jgi:NAD(P)H-nitrite reductase large subunit
MHTYKYLIVGGGAAGTSAAETIRQHDKHGSIAIVSDESHPLYSRVMLSKPGFFLGKIPFDQIYLKKESWYVENKIDFLGGKKAVSIETSSKNLSLSDGSHLHYEELLIATGVDVNRWKVSGCGKKGIHYLRSLQDGIDIMEAIKTAKCATTIGGGFISFEMADLLQMAGLDTTMILRESYFWEPTLDNISGIMIEKALTKGGVKLIKNAEITQVIGDEKVTEVILKDGTKISCDLIICGIGVTNSTNWLANSGIAINRGIITNEFMETNVPHIFAAGDIAEYNDLLLEEHVVMGNWINAIEQGRVAGMNMVHSQNDPSWNNVNNQKTPFRFVSFYTTSGFGISIAFVGDVAPGPDRTIVNRGSAEINSYARIILRNNEVEGATLINRNNEMSAISKLIEQNTKVGDKLEKLADPNFDLKELIA